MNRLRVGILTHIKHPIRQPFAGGLEAFTYDVTLALRARGHDVTLFASSRSAPELLHTSIISDDDYDPDGVDSRGKKEAFFREYLGEHVAYMQCMQGIDAQRFDVIFNNSLHYVRITMGSIVATPMLTVLHTPPFFEMTSAFSAVAQKPTQRVCTISHANATNWSKWVTPCEVIHNGIDVTMWKPTSEKPRNRAMWYGRIVPDKGLHHAIDAAKAAGIPLDIAGHANDRSYFQTEIAPRLDADVIYLGHLSRNEVIEHLQRAAVCVVSPCWDEPFGLVVAEALACGTPVAAYGRGGLVELLTPETGVLAKPGDASSLACAIKQAIELDREVCRQHAVRHFGRDKMLDSYEKVLFELAELRQVNA
ncbi:glycosyltransferase [Robbsia sp. KACC 23696]|uniref:glycosyltransferase n=1 Tax=Robbsia sp. KACC 23696 TaxID=3149231 RepID=UPI00325AEBF0